MSNCSCHLLLVDSHEEARKRLACVLRNQGWEVTEAGSGGRARLLAQERSVELVLLEKRLPDEDGQSLCRFFSHELALAVIFLTATKDQVSKIEGLDAGADDYVCKPFDLAELMARMRTVLRRYRRRAESALSPEVEVKRYAFGHWVLDLGQHALYTDEQKNMPLSTGEFRLLKVLVQNAGKVLSRDRLLDLTRGEETMAFDRSIDNQINRLRKKLEVNPRKPALLKTAWGEGYFLSAEVSLL